MESILQLIGKPWVAGSDGPDEFDCWGLLAWVYRQHLGIELNRPPGLDVHQIRSAAAEILKAQAERLWIDVKRPEPFDAVGMGHGHMITHVGVWLPIDAGTVLHCSRPQGGVVMQPPASLRQQHLQLTFWRWHKRF